MDIETLDDLYAHRLETVYSVEAEQRDILPVLEDDVRTNTLDASGDDTLRRDLLSLIQDHREQTDSQIDRLETAFEQVGRRPNTREVPTLDGLVDEKERFNNVILNDAFRPAYYIGFLKRIEQLEILGYETLLEIATALELGEETTEPLEANLAEERDCFDRLDSYAPYEGVE